MSTPPPTTNSTSWPAGIQIGRWRVDELLGEGGTARVFAATSADGERAAIKVLREELAADESMKKRFLREARVADLIGHKGVVRVLEDGSCEDGSPFIAMELLEGESLEARYLRKGERLSVKEVLWIADQCLDVLAAAHRKGVVHRDIKPENLFLTFDRRLKVLDFGIAGLRDLLQQQDTTRIGVVMGTPAFMPPEQARGDWQNVGMQTDLWSVGATMYTLLSGRLVHEEGMLIDQIFAATSRPALSLALVAPHVPAPVVNLVDFALAFDAPSRWPTARAMQGALRLSYAEWRRQEQGIPENIEEALDMTEQPVRVFERPEAPPMSLRRPPR
jgi:eukaryotic-like serine/threonine-protein kinase